ncbi:hypothetical protein C5167_026073 [Papaver somniferum]|nr:hypothetical protein C5167_026073 [Papaver somniferum]
MSQSGLSKYTERVVQQQQVAALTLSTGGNRKGRAEKAKDGLNDTNVDSKTLLRPLDDVDMEGKSSA